MPIDSNILEDQQCVIDGINRLIPNFKKKGKVNMTRGATQGRIELLQNLWRECQALNNQLNRDTSEEDLQDPYFQESRYMLAEEAYLDALTFLYDHFESLNQSVLPTINDNQNPTPKFSVRLPKIDIPKFSGNYLEWENFRDLFESLIHDNATLTNVQRFHYLKTNLDGEASQLLKSVLVTEANYNSAWNTLKARYNNKRVLVMSHLQSLMNVPFVSSESAIELRQLRDKTNESLAALKNLNRPVESWDDIMVFLTVQKLDAASHKEWELSLGGKNEFPSYAEINEFLENRARALEAIHTASASQIQTTTASALNSTSSKRTREAQVPNLRSHHASENASNDCIYCNQSHLLARCPTFRKIQLVQRKEFVKNNHCCYNCLRTGHMVQQCTSQGRCKHCNSNHHTLLHYSTSVNSANVTKPETSAATSDSSVTVGCHFASRTNGVNLKTILLATANVELRTAAGRSVQVRALIDPGSETSFVTKSIVKTLHTSQQKIRANISGLEGHSTFNVNSAVSLLLKPCHANGPVLPFDAFVLPTLTSYAPKATINWNNWPYLQGLKFADPEPSSSAKIEILIGADIYGQVLLDGVHSSSDGGPLAQRTIFGWILSGAVSSSQAPQSSGYTVHHCICTNQLDKTLRKFWENEELPKVRLLTEQEQKCEEHFKSTHVRELDGRYTVRLPFKQDLPINIGDSLAKATLLFYKQESRLMKNSAHLQSYVQFMEEYQQLGHMECVQGLDLPPNSQVVYLPHHAVFRETSSTTRLRVVFNASSLSSNGTSLNDHLLPGPKLLPDLVSIILRWRKHPIAIVADIEKMYRQIRMNSDDANFQRILWRSSQDQELKAFKLQTVTYGTASAPYLALRVIKQLASDERKQYPVASQILENDLYVDDLLSGASSVTAAKRMCQDLNSLLQSGGFTLRKWASNNFECLEDIPEDHCVMNDVHCIQEDESIHVLGLMWDPHKDLFKFHVSIASFDNVALTKRSILSVTAKLFDPLGWLTPVVIIAKIIMQELWLLKIDWDEPIPRELQLKWHDYCSVLPQIQEITVPRYTGQQDSLHCEIHGFSDASTRAYAAAVYLRVIQDDNIQVRLLIAKSKVAPVKTISLPRLELCAAQLLTRLIEYVVSAMKFETIPMFAWTDSTVTLAWIKSHSSRWQTFVANRVADIQTRLPDATWRHVPTADNAADCASRGMSPDKLIDHSLWWNGPPWLSQPSSFWPQSQRDIPLHIDVETRTHHVQLAQEKAEEWDLPLRFSSWSRFLRVTAYCLRFIQNLRLKANQRSLSGLSGNEIRNARTFWIKYVQQRAFEKEIRSLQLKTSLPIGSCLAKLNPFIDDSGLIRVGGRLRHSPLAYNEKHPYVLPRHPVSTLIVNNAHARTLHGGPQLTIRIIRQNYWILGCRQLVKSHINHCVRCIRERAKGSSQIMGDLCTSRISPSRPFLHTGVDYAGPLLVRTAKGRGHKTHKAYVAVFVCLAVRAVHLELVSDYTSSGFIAAFQRFTARRGIPSDLYSDNGTNFVGADAELRQAFKAVSHDKNLVSQLASDSTTWHFLPPAAPHFGGLWEAGVKAFKHHLRRVIGSHTLTFEELATFLALTEASLNSRPLGPLHDDPNDFTALTPGHFLIGTPIAVVPEPSLLNIQENRLSRWQLVRKLHEHIWNRWSSEYLHTLQGRQKWKHPESNITVNELVLIKNELQPPSKWLLGRVTEIHPGSDDRVRVVTVKTATSTMKRPIVKLCRLLISEPSDKMSK